MPRNGRQPQRKSIRRPRKTTLRESHVSLTEDVEPEIRVVVPQDQLKDLTKQQLDEEKTIALDAVNPNLPKELVIYHCSKNEYVEDERELTHLMIHFSLESQIKEKIIVTEPEITEQQGDTNDAEVNEVEINEEPKKEKKEEAEEEVKPKIKLRNQFKYSERGCQTFNQPTRDRSVATIPPKVREFSQNVNRWKIYDAYVMELMIKVEQQDKDTKDKKSSPAMKNIWKNNNPSALRLLHSDELRESTKQMEYVVHHNSENDVYNDMKFWKGDPKKTELNHLWRVKSSERRCVTSIIFNKQYTEMFAVGMGSYDFSRPKNGIVSIYTKKNPTHPELSFETNSGVMCMDFSSSHPSLLCVGFYNGSVGVYDIRKQNHPCIYQVNNPEEYHKDPVWEVRWSVDGDMSFLSISSDGTMVKWILSKNELNREVLMNLKRSDACDDKEGLLRVAQATTFDINPVNMHQCLVGTEFGEIYCYNLNQKNELPTEFEGHNMQVYGICWSPFDPSTFLSCSEDWTVKLWNVKQKNPIISYDLVAPVGDINWSQYSSTLFHAVTYDNKIHVFDLSVNKNDATIHHSSNSKKYSTTKVTCAADAPILITGNKFGILDILKIPEHVGKFSEIKEEEVKKLENVLAIMGTNVLDLKQIKPSQHII